MTRKGWLMHKPIVTQKESSPKNATTIEEPINQIYMPTLIKTTSSKPSNHKHETKHLKSQSPIAHYRQTDSSTAHHMGGNQSSNVLKNNKISKQQSDANLILLLNLMAQSEVQNERVQKKLDSLDEKENLGVEKMEKEFKEIQRKLDTIYELNEEKRPSSSPKKTLNSEELKVIYDSSKSVLEEVKLLRHDLQNIHHQAVALSVKRTISMESGIQTEDVDYERQKLQQKRQESLNLKKMQHQFSSTDDLVISKDSSTEPIDTYPYNSMSNPQHTNRTNTGSADERLLNRQYFIHNNNICLKNEHTQQLSLAKQVGDSTSLGRMASSSSVMSSRLNLGLENEIAAGLLYTAKRHSLQFNNPPGQQPSISKSNLPPTNNINSTSSLSIQQKQKALNQLYSSNVRHVHVKASTASNTNVYHDNKNLNSDMIMNEEYQDSRQQTSSREQVPLSKFNNIQNFDHAEENPQPSGLHPMPNAVRHQKQQSSVKKTTKGHPQPNTFLFLDDDSMMYSLSQLIMKQQLKPNNKLVNRGIIMRDEEVDEGGGDHEILVKREGYQRSIIAKNQKPGMIMKTNKLNNYNNLHKIVNEKNSIIKNKHHDKLNDVHEQSISLINKRTAVKVKCQNEKNELDKLIFILNN